MSKELKKGIRRSGVAGVKEMTVIVKVAKRFPERHSEKFKLKTFGQEREISTFMLDTPNYKKLLGREGWMTQADYEKGLYKDYGLKEEDVAGNTALEKETKRAEALELELIELKNQLAQDKTPGKKDSKPEKEEGVR